jgi:hypothetical protein
MAHLAILDNRCFQRGSDLGAGSSQPARLVAVRDRPDVGEHAAAFQVGKALAFPVFGFVIERFYCQRSEVIQPLLAPSGSESVRSNNIGASASARDPR